MARIENGEPVGARRVAKRRGGPPWLAVLLVLLVLLLLAAGIWFLLADDDSDVEAVDGASAPTTTASPGTSPPTGDGAAGPGEVFAGGQRVLPGGEGQLTRVVGQPAEGRSVGVLSVPSDEGFWVGTDNTNRVFVHLALAPSESPFDIDPGDTVSFSGTVRALPPDPQAAFGLTPAEGLADLRRHGAYIEATQVTRS